MLVDREMTPVGFEPTQLALVELESTPLDHSGKVSLVEGDALCAVCRVARCAPRNRRESKER